MRAVCISSQHLPPHPVFELLFAQDIDYAKLIYPF